MNKRDIRLRRDYLYRKNLEGQELIQHEHKRLLSQSLASGKSTLPTELYNTATNIHKQLQYDDTVHNTVNTHVDDEYNTAGNIDPKILLTTSRTPSTRLINFVKELSLCIPHSIRINRGNTKINELLQQTRQHEFTDIIIIHEHRGEPDGMIISHLPYGPTAYLSLSNVVMRHDITNDKLSTISEQLPHLVFNGFTSKLGQRTSNILKHLYPIPKSDSKRIISFTNVNDQISFRHHIYKKLMGKDQYELHEIGPRFECMLYQLKLGTVEMKDAENEWILRPYMNTAKKRKAM